MPSFDLQSYPEPLADLLRRLPLAPLGPGTPDESVRPALAALAEVPSACRAGLWLAFNYLDESHSISQDLHTKEGSYWHALMHRREPDHANAGYWLRKVATHTIHADLARAAADLGYGVKRGGWDAFAFNDACERHRGKGDTTEELLRKVQRAEWELLFAYCFRRATGGAEGR
jgi:hypothetical protein